MDPLSEFIRGITRDNPTFGLVLGLCPTLAVSTSVENGIGMAAGTAFVLIFSNLFVSLVRKVTPSEVRLPVFIIIIATFVSIVDMVMKAFFPPMYAALGVFIPLIVVNCIIIGRAEAYASKNNAFYSVIDALGVSTGFLLVLMLIGGIREILGTGQIVTFGHTLISLPVNPSVTTMILPGGAFLTIGILMAIINYQKEKKRVRGE
ncbi:electron transport complex, RnfABCDGE type, E subunit [Methanomethylovorans hollandica DSM 15978]|jgi:electron transport complex protein RnfE|uniref:Ion-translocating oxidoreductase complex subunit E n=1 Tax=Methanomethylovorans hollandica (strain DSM 15978 / NBRC 107637 / DMS1) TaxID=867904 RepID=L0KXG8_METHD|nr:Rnf electron transport complex subunit RnfE [Methanomethylovorans hollandica]AGB48684.1 electron transport complex, RnfABCDGE type, E subunit [Methanomethylovorans hollandica DSM 15978]